MKLLLVLFALVFSHNVTANDIVMPANSMFHQGGNTVGNFHLLRGQNGVSMRRFNISRPGLYKVELNAAGLNSPVVRIYIDDILRYEKTILSTNRTWINFHHKHIFRGLHTIKVETVDMQTNQVFGFSRVRLKFVKDECFNFGASARRDPFLTEPLYSATVINNPEYNGFVHGNYGKFSYTQPHYSGNPSTDFTFGGFDQLIAGFLMGNIRYHAFFWHASYQIPNYVYGLTGPETGDLIRYNIEHKAARLNSHIYSHLGSVANFYHVDVLNENLQDQSPFNQRIGGNGGNQSVWNRYSLAKETMFIESRKHMPDSTLFYNDYGVFARPNLAVPHASKGDKMYEMITEMIDQGIPVDAVGFQGHFKLHHVPSKNHFLNLFEDYAKRGLEVAITELDISIRKNNNGTPVDPNDLILQANAYRRIFEACQEARNCNTVYVWGVNDANSWINNSPHFQGFGLPLLWDDNYNAKPAWDSVKDYLNGPTAAMPLCAR